MLHYWKGIIVSLSLITYVHTNTKQKSNGSIRGMWQAAGVINLIVAFLEL